MKKNIFRALLLAAVVTVTSCSDFLDTVPDNRAEINTDEKITSLLVSAYPKNFPVAMWELSSDNVTDNGALYTMESRGYEEAYLWKDITENDSDFPQDVWDACYSAAATANLVLQAVDAAAAEGRQLTAQKGEALLCRAYAHFILATTFCEAYDPNTAGQKLGIPYATIPETTVKPVYERGTLQATYENIAKDIEAGFPLLDDNLHSVTKYHFNKRAAAAFATRFYLYYTQLDRSNLTKVISYADYVLGANPTKSIRQYYTDMASFTDLDNKSDAYISVKSPANTLLLPIYTSWPYVYGPYNINKRYGMNRALTEGETLWSSNVFQSSNTIYERLNGSDQKLCLYKYRSHFEYTDKTAGIGYRHTVLSPLSSNETLLCRAEAYALMPEPDYPKALADMNTWVSSITNGAPTKTLTLDAINDFYDGKKYAPDTIKSDNDFISKKKLHPVIAFRDSIQENVMHTILQMRRLETMHDGLRWLDIKRYGISVCHVREGLDPLILTADDPRRAIQLPQDVINAGLTPNPRTKK